MVLRCRGWGQLDEEVERSRTVVAAHREVVGVVFPMMLLQRRNSGDAPAVLQQELERGKGSRSERERW